MSTVYVADFNAARGTLAPTHLWIAHVQKGLARSLEKENRCGESRSLETLIGPVCLAPFYSVLILPGFDSSQNARCDVQPLSERRPPKHPKPLPVVVNHPQQP